MFPIHLEMAPALVVKFIKKLDLRSAEYIFAIATRAGTQYRAFIDIENILKKKGKRLDSFFTLIWPVTIPNLKAGKQQLKKKS